MASGGRSFRATAATTRSASRGGNRSGHWEIAWELIPMASAALATDPPSISIAFAFCIPRLLANLQTRSSTLTLHTSKLSYMQTLQERIAELMAATGLTVGELADTAGVTSSAATQWKDGPTKTLKAAPAARLSARTGFSALWLSSGEGPKMAPEGAPHPLSSNVADAPALAASKLVPVVGHVKGGTDGYLEEMQFPAGYGEGFVEFWTKDSAAYALRVKGDSMHPRYRAGEYIVVTPSIEAQPGRDVVVKLRDGRKLLKQLNWVRSGEVQLLSINDGYGPTTLSADEIESIHRVAGGVPQDAFQEATGH